MGASFSGLIRYKQNGELTKATTDLIIPVSQLSSLSNTLSITEDIQVELLGILIDSLKELGFIGVDGSGLVALSKEGIELWQDSSSRTILDYLEERLSRGKYLGKPIVDVFKNRDVEIPEAVISSSIELKVGLMMLSWLGKITIIHHDNFRVIITDSTIDRVSTGHVMPDFSTFIPSEIEPYMLFRFLQVGVIGGRDVVYQGTVTKEAVINSLARGVKLDSLTELVASWHGTPNLLSSLEEWGKQFNELYIDKPYLAVNLNLADTIAIIPELQDIMEPVTDYKMFRIKDGATDEVSKLLLKFGYDVRFPNEVIVENRVNLKSTPLVEMKPNFSLDFTKSPTQEKSYFGKYSSALRKLPLGELLKVINYAIYMDEKLNLLYFGKECLVTPKVVRIGEPGELEAITEAGDTVKYLLESIDKVGVIHNDS
jgi:hypothetical protein